MTEVWSTGLSHPAVVARMAERAEAAGWDGMYVVDSQNLAGDAFVGLTLAAQATTRLGLGTGVSNPATRHPAAAAAGIASVHAVSGGRAVFGVGRGDSALAHLGTAPASVARLEAFARVVRTYLRGEDVAFDDLASFNPPGARSVSTLGLAGEPEESRLHWLGRDLSPVPVEVVATGPRMLEAAGRVADRVLLAVGADRERVAWAADRARAAGATSVGAFVNVVTHPDLAVARRIGAGGLATFARFSAMDGTVRTPIDPAQQEVLEAVHGAYDMGHHTRAGSPQAGQLTDDFADTFGIVGSPAHCVDRLAALVGLGIDKLVVVGPSGDADRDDAIAATRLFTAEVLPAIQAMGS